MSPSRRVEMAICWNCVHSWASRMIGCETRGRQVERYQLPYAQVARHHQPGPQPQRGNRDQFANQAN